MRCLGIVWVGVCAGLMAGLPVAAAEWTAELGTAWRWSRWPVPEQETAARLQDLNESSDGTLWLTTKRGIYWYDGYGWMAGKGLGKVSRVMPRPGLRSELLTISERSIYGGGRHGFEVLAGPNCAVDGAAELPGCQGTLVQSQGGQWRKVSDSAVASGVMGETLYATGDAIWWADAQGLHRRSPDGESRLWLAAGNGRLYVRVLAENARGDGVMTVDSPASLRGLWQWRRNEPARRVPEEGASVASTGSVHPDGAALMVYESGHVRLRRDGVWRDLAQAPQQLR